MLSYSWSISGSIFGVVGWSGPQKCCLELLAFWFLYCSNLNPGRVFPLWNEQEIWNLDLVTLTEQENVHVQMGNLNFGSSNIAFCCVLLNQCYSIRNSKLPGQIPGRIRMNTLPVLRLLQFKNQMPKVLDDISQARTNLEIPKSDHTYFSYSQATSIPGISWFFKLFIYKIFAGK